MDKESVKLLMIDLSARAPFGVMCDRRGIVRKLAFVEVDKDMVVLSEIENILSGYRISNDDETVKPYLRSIEDMTHSEYDEYLRIKNSSTCS